MTIEYKNSITYSHNPDKDEVMRYINNATLSTLRGFLTEDDNLYIWDADRWIHNEVSRCLNIDGIRFCAGHLHPEDKYRYVIASRSEQDKAKLLASPSVQATGLEVS